MFLDVALQQRLPLRVFAWLCIWLASWVLLRNDFGLVNTKVKFREIFFKSSAINTLSMARMLLFGARDVLFVVALPVFLSQELMWSHGAVGSFLASWVIAYGIVQGIAPKITGSSPDGRTATISVAVLAVIPLLLALVLNMVIPASVEWSLIVGLLVFGAVFAVNSSLHSFLIVDYAAADGVVPVPCPLVASLLRLLVLDQVLPCCHDLAILSSSPIDPLTAIYCR